MGSRARRSPSSGSPWTRRQNELDIAVLKLGSGTSIGRRTAKLWPAKRLPLETKAFGYPIKRTAEPRGVWRDSRVSGAVQGGRVQLDWDEVGTLAGHSGGPVCDKESGLMVGVLVEGAETGHFDRMVPLTAVRRIWDGLPRPWLFAGEDARTHFTQRAAGQRSIARGGDLFRGRREALGVVARMALRRRRARAPAGDHRSTRRREIGGHCPRRLGDRAHGQCDGVAFHARGAAVADLVDAVSAACGLDTPSSWQELVAALTAQDGHEDTMSWPSMRSMRPRATRT